jgi:unsaturated rhamnogalacturonyl hydrolase
MKPLSFTLFVISFFTLFQSGGQPISKKSVLALTHKVADWQLSNPNATPMGDWVQGPFINGLLAVSKLPGGKKYGDSVYKIGIQEKWGVIKTDWKANDHCTPQAWIELYEKKKQPVMIGEIRKELDNIIEVVSAQDDSLEFRKKNNMKWSWCDALFMSPPTYARMGKVTGNQKYFDFLNKWWWRVSAFYYDKNEHLYFRDETFFRKREPNGSKIFWSRGNGWVIGGLVRVLQYLPSNDPYRPEYEQQLREMCIKIKEIQGVDSLWHAGLLDPVAHKQVETSGSAFFVYGLAYALNNGIIDKKSFRPVVDKAWTALFKYVKPDGRFSGTQPIGDSPVKYDENFTMPYGVGAFLLAGSEMYQLLKK